MNGFLRSCYGRIMTSLFAAFLSASTALAENLLAIDDGSLIGRFEDLMTLPPQKQAPTYRNMDRLYPTRVIGTAAFPLPQGRPLDVKYSVNGETLSVDDFMARNNTAGLLVLKGGEVVLERYAMGNNARTKWNSFSMSKSITSTLVGAAIQDGLIKSLDDPVTRYVPLLQDSAYEGVTVRQVLQMRSGVKWSENYLDPSSERRKMLAVQVAHERGGVLKFMRELPRAAEPGTLFNYNSGESYVLGEILAGAIKRPLSKYLSEKIWAPFGMESDAYWELDAPGGQEVAGSGVNATLRDFGRFGLFILNNGVIGGTQVLPSDWIAQSTSVDPASLSAPGKLKGYEPGGYGYQWWTFPVGDRALPNLDGGLFAALGIFGQQIYLNPKERLVVVIHSTWPEPIYEKSLVETYALLGAMTGALRGQ